MIRKRSFMTMTEIMIATTLSGVLLVMLLTTLLSTREGIKSESYQTMFLSTAKFGAERILKLVRNGQAISVSEDGQAALILNPDKSITAVFYVDEDGNSTTVDNNYLKVDYDYSTNYSADEELVKYVTPLSGEPMFEVVGSGLTMRFHVGDPSDVKAADHITGEGYQGVQMRLSAQPREVGHTWSSGIND